MVLRTLGSCKDGTVSVREEAEVVGEGVVVNGMPIAADECADKEQKRRLRLVEIRNQLIHHMKCITGFDHDLRLGVQGRLARSIEIIKDSLHSFRS